jgi:hypothetical protein
MSNEPRVYDLDKPEEIHRLHREVLGYLIAGESGICPYCRKVYREGTDFEGRRFAIDALKKILSNGRLSSLLSK